MGEFYEHVTMFCNCRTLGSEIITFVFCTTGFSLSVLRLLIHIGFFSKTGSDTFRSVFLNGKEQESRKKLLHNRAKIYLPEKV